MAIVISIKEHDKPMPVPGFQELFWPALEALKDNKEHSITEIYNSAARYLNLSDEVLAVKMKNFDKGVVNYRTNWALLYLHKAGLIIRVRRGIYKISDEGLALLEKKLGQINARYLKTNYASFRDWKQGDRSNSDDSSDTGSSEVKAPIEIIDENIDIIHNELGLQLMEQILNKPPAFFEHVVKTLLQAMGYGQGKVTGQSGDGGIDGFVNEDALGLETIYFQAKRYSPGTPVGSSMIRDFIGTLQMHGKDKGVFITSSTFPRGVNETAEKSHKKVVFIDGSNLVKLMIHYDVGVRIIREIKVKSIDQDFFEADDSL